MSTTTQTTTPSVSRGFEGLPCPFCGEYDGITISLATLTADDACKCTGCDAEFGMARVREFIKEWSAVLAWIDMAPVIE